MISHNIQAENTYLDSNKLDFTIRPAIIDDLPFIISIENQSFNDDPFTLNQFKYLLLKSNCTFKVMILNDVIVGYGINLYRSNSTNARIYSIAISNNYRGQGLGSIMIMSLVVLAYDRKCTSLTLEVSDQNLSAIKLYQKLGFVETKKLIDYYGLGKHGIKMKRAIP